jgi:LEA14-like dessication related protein
MTRYVHGFAASILAGFALSSCATPPPPVSAPPPPLPLSLELRDVRVAPDGPRSVSVSFTLAASNPGAEAAKLEEFGWSLSLAGERIDAAALPGLSRLEGGASAAIPVKVSAAVPAAAGAEADYAIRASAERAAADGRTLASSAEAGGRVAVVREPVFSVRSIKIKKAELINTRFEVVLRVENPNAVPLRLLSLEYELFGDRRLWTDGSAAEAFTVPAKGAVDGKLSLTMNFIDMKRELLDQVIRLQVVDYRFRGKARIATELPGFPDFTMPYDLTGRTSVVE